jgi:hypothetical protein
MGPIKTMRLVATDVRGGVFEGCGHYLPEEAPRAFMFGAFSVFWPDADIHDAENAHGPGPEGLGLRRARGSTFGHVS